MEHTYKMTCLIARGLNTQFPHVYEATKHVLSHSVSLKNLEFNCPLPSLQHNVTVLLIDLDTYDVNPSTATATSSEGATCAIMQTTSGGTVQRNVDVSHIM